MSSALFQVGPGGFQYIVLMQEGSSTGSASCDCSVRILQGQPCLPLAQEEIALGEGDGDVGKAALGYGHDVCPLSLHKPEFQLRLEPETPDVGTLSIPRLRLLQVVLGTPEMLCLERFWSLERQRHGTVGQTHVSAGDVPGNLCHQGTVVLKTRYGTVDIVELEQRLSQRPQRDGQAMRQCSGISRGETRGTEGSLPVGEAVPKQAQGGGQIIRVVEDFGCSIELADLPYLVSLSLSLLIVQRIGIQGSPEISEEFIQGPAPLATYVALPPLGFSRLRLQQSDVSLEEMLHVLDSVQGLRLMAFMQVERIRPVLLELGKEIACCTYPACRQEIVEKSNRFLVALTGKVLLRCIPLC